MPNQLIRELLMWDALVNIISSHVTQCPHTTVLQ